MLIARRGSQLIDDYGGLSGRRRCWPGPSSSPGSPALSLPGLSTFISEFLVLVGTFTRYPAAAVVATVGIVLASLYILLTYQRMFTGPVREFAAGWRDMNVREAWVVAPLVAVIVALGFFPKPVLDVLNPAVSRTMQQTSSRTRPHRAGRDPRRRRRDRTVTALLSIAGGPPALGASPPSRRR